MEMRHKSTQRYARHLVCRFTGQCLALTAILFLTLGVSPTTDPTNKPPAVLTLDLGKNPGKDPGQDQTLDLVLIPAGSFIMGSPESEADRDDNEGPQHEVKIAHAFYIGKYAITQAQYQAVTGYNQAQFKTFDRQPEECVSWTDAQNFCTQASKRTGKKVRLPTEAEWEYADRAGTQTVFWVGDDLSSTQANFNGKEPYGKGEKGPRLEKTAIVGSYKPNAFGLYDTIGNVGEWCQDSYHDSYNNAPADGSAWETGADPEIRIYRGGAYDSSAASCRSAARYAAERKNNRNSRIGFRVVVEKD
jgi:formylglycine-generating enzyme required for sulfatase activity